MNNVISITKTPTTSTTGTIGGTNVADTYGGFTNYPSQWGTASNTLTNIANSSPANYGDWYNKAKATTQYDINDAIRQAVETAGMGGTRWSSPLGRTAQDIGARYTAGLGAQYAQNEMNAYQQNIQNQLAAAGGLGSLGQQYAYLPMDVAGNMMSMGNQMQNAYNQQINPYYGMWNQMQDYNSPWLSQIGNATSNYGASPTTYNPSFFSQIMDMFFG